jgi:hypothetical protein
VTNWEAQAANLERTVDGTEMHIFDFCRGMISTKTRLDCSLNVGALFIIDIIADPDTGGDCFLHITIVKIMIMGCDRM